MVKLMAGVKDINVLRKILYKLNKDLEDIDSFFYTYFKLNPKNANEYIMMENKVKALDATIQQKKNLSGLSEKVFIERSNTEWNKRKDVKADQETVNNAIVALEKALIQNKATQERMEITLISLKASDELVRFMIEKGW